MLLGLWDWNQQQLRNGSRKLLLGVTEVCRPTSCPFPLFQVRFGEAADQDSQELFGLISQFVHDFKRAHADLKSGVTAADPHG